jgi:hypothetical protein
MTTPYIGTPAAHVAGIALPADDDEPTSTLFASPLADLADMIAYTQLAAGVTLTSYYIPLALAGAPQGGDAGQDPFVWDTVIDGTGWVQGSISGNLRMGFELDVPAGSKITEIVLTCKGTWNGNVHGALPAGMPQVEVISIDTAGASAVVVAPVADTSVDVAHYEASHLIVLNPIAVTTLANIRYLVQVVGENGANAVARALQIQCIAVVKVQP